MIMSVQIGPDGGIGVEIFAALGVAKHCAPAAQDDDRIVPEPVAHLREGMPDVFLIGFRERVGRPPRANGGVFAVVLEGTFHNFETGSKPERFSGNHEWTLIRTNGIEAVSRRKVLKPAAARCDFSLQPGQRNSLSSLVFIRVHWWLNFMIAPKASIRQVTSARECAADKVMRKRAEPRATVG